MDFHEILRRHSWSPEDEHYLLWWSFNFSRSTIMMFTLLVVSEISQQLCDEFLLVCTFIPSRGMIVISEYPSFFICLELKCCAHKCLKVTVK